MNADTPRLRLSIIGIVAFSLFAALFARLLYLQVMTSSEYQVAAQTISTRRVAVEAPRGRILDRNGNILVRNRISVQVTIDRSVLGALRTDERSDVLNRLADRLSRFGLAIGVDQLEERIADKRYSPFVPVPVAADVPELLKIWIDEHRDELPSVAAERVAVREYPYGRLAAHVIGWTGKVTKAELDAIPDDLAAAKPYTVNDEIGKAGIEKVYEADLRGTPGQRTLEVDAKGNPVRVLSEQLPVPGDDIVLNLDINLQAIAEQALKTALDKAAKRPPSGRDHPNVGKVGSTVVLDPATGGVLALASAPTFAPADFVDGVSQSEWDFLQAKENHYPLNNWAIQGQYAPGSTLKPFSAAAGLKTGLITPQKSINDQGVYTIPNCKDERCERQNDGRTKYGMVDLQRSLTVSSDVYYYDLGAQFWIQREAIGGPERFREELEEWGFYSRTGIDLPSEQIGRIPSQKWKQEYCEAVKDRAPCAKDADRWYTGDSVNMAIGQGDDLATPLQLAVAYAALGNGGTRWKPQLAREVQDGRSREVKRSFKPVELGHVEMAPEWREAIVQGLIGVTTREGGTAAGAFAGFPSNVFPVAAKTGTAQVRGKAPTAVFGSFAPAYEPRYAISVLLEESGYGGSAAAPIARRLYDVLISPDPIPDARQTTQAPEPTELSPDPGDVRD